MSRNGPEQMPEQHAPNNRLAFGMQGTPLAAWQTSRALTAVPYIFLMALVPEQTRVIVVAPHPDDETLGGGGLLAGLATRGCHLQVIAVTDGEGSHPGSRLWSPDRLRAQRRRESRIAMERLGFSPDQVAWRYLGLPDGRVAAEAPRLQAALQALLRPGDTVLTTWREDGHCDHEATGRIVARCAAAARANLIEVPVWAWHWAAPEDPRIPWHRARKLALDQPELMRKRNAANAHQSQLQPDTSTGAAPVLPQPTLARLLQPFELVFL